MYCFTKQATLMMRSTVLNLPLQFVFPDNNLQVQPSLIFEGSCFGNHLYSGGTIGLQHPLYGITNPRYTLLRFIQLTNFFCKEKKALAFNQDRCCHLALCLWLILFHCSFFGLFLTNLKLGWECLTAKKALAY